MSAVSSISPNNYPNAFSEEARSTTVFTKGIQEIIPLTRNDEDELADRQVIVTIRKAISVNSILSSNRTSPSNTTESQQTTQNEVLRNDDEPVVSNVNADQQNNNLLNMFNAATASFILKIPIKDLPADEIKNREKFFQKSRVTDIWRYIKFRNPHYISDQDKAYCDNYLLSQTKNALVQTDDPHETSTNYVTAEEIKQTLGVGINTLRLYALRGKLRTQLRSEDGVRLYDLLEVQKLKKQSDAKIATSSYVTAETIEDRCKITPATLRLYVLRRRLKNQFTSEKGICLYDLLEVQELKKQIDAKIAKQTQ